VSEGEELKASGRDREPKLALRPPVLVSVWRKLSITDVSDCEKRARSISSPSWSIELRGRPPDPYVPVSSDLRTNRQDRSNERVCDTRKAREQSPDADCSAGEPCFSC
jgi:hypothetical protein